MNKLGKKFMYFADGNGANATGEAYAVEAGALVGVKPKTTTTTVAYFMRSADAKDKITFTHDNTTATTGHRCREISKALAEASNAGPHHDGMTDIADLDNSIFYSNLKFISALSIALID